MEFLPISAVTRIYLCREPLSGQSRVYQVTQLRTDDVHCRESAGTGAEAFKVVPGTGAAFSGVTRDNLMCASLATFTGKIYPTTIDFDLPIIVEPDAKFNSYYAFLYFLYLTCPLNTKSGCGKREA